MWVGDGGNVKQLTKKCKQLIKKASLNANLTELYNFISLMLMLAFKR